MARRGLNGRGTRTQTSKDLDVCDVLKYERTPEKTKALV